MSNVGKGVRLPNPELMNRTGLQWLQRQASGQKPEGDTKGDRGSETGSQTGSAYGGGAGSRGAGRVAGTR